MIVRNQDQNFLKALTVLYVEDEPETREQFSAFLRRPVGTLITAVNGAEGLEAFVRHAPDIVVTDILMPYMDGLDMAGEIRKIAPAVPIIVVTAFENTEYLMRAIEIGVDKYVVKPVVSNLLLERLLECAHRLRAEEQLELVHQHEIQEMAAKHQRHHDELRIIFELSTAGILLGDDQGLITFASGRMAEMLGYSADELANTRYIDHVHPDDLRGVTENMQRLLTGKVRNIDSEHRYMRKDGSYFWGHLTASCIEDESKTLVVVLSDVGVRKRAEEERLKLEHQLLHAQKLESVGVLAGGIAHDFNNVLTVINGYANLLQTTIKDDDESQLFAREISDSVCRAADMTRSILAFSGKHEMLMKYDDLNQILSNISRSLGRLIREDIAMPVVYGDGKFAVFADRGQIEQLLINLVVNARDATGSGGTISVATMLVESEEPRIEGNALIPPGRYACLSVADSGSGMTDETIEHIFEPFYTTKSKGKGTGLGLSIVHSIVTKHKGWLSVTSAPGRGSEFRVYLPLYAGEMPERRSEVRQTVTLQGTETVLMVEDNSDVMKLHKEMLGRCGYTMLSASDGVEALELFSAHRDEIQIAVVDVIMPRMNGVELVGRIRQECPDLPIIMTSGYADEIIDRAAINELEVLFLHKPVKRLDLLIAIRSCLDT